MSRDPLMTTEYRQIRWLPLVILVSILSVVTLFYSFIQKLRSEQPSGTTSEIHVTTKTQTETEASPTPYPKVTLPAPTSYPTLTESQHQDLITELEKLNPPDEALNEIKGYPFNESN